MAAWTNKTWTFRERLTAAQLNALDANLDALAEGASGAPAINVNSFVVTGVGSLASLRVSSGLTVAQVSSLATMVGSALVVTGVGSLATGIFGSLVTTGVGSLAALVTGHAGVTVEIANDSHSNVEKVLLTTSLATRGNIVFLHAFGSFGATAGDLPRYRLRVGSAGGALIGNQLSSFPTAGMRATFSFGGHTLPASGPASYVLTGENGAVNQVNVFDLYLRAYEQIMR